MPFATTMPSLSVIYFESDKANIQLPLRRARTATMLAEVHSLVRPPFARRYPTATLQ